MGLTYVITTGSKMIAEFLCPCCGHHYIKNTIDCSGGIKATPIYDEYDSDTGKIKYEALDCCPNCGFGYIYGEVVKEG